ncbi:hypothetical protein DSECCO2_516890 [anaerobic digester metagenome]
MARCAPPFGSFASRSETATSPAFRPRPCLSRRLNPVVMWSRSLPICITPFFEAMARTENPDRTASKEYSFSLESRNRTASIPSVYRARVFATPSIRAAASIPASSRVFSSRSTSRGSSPRGGTARTPRGASARLIASFVTAARRAAAATRPSSSRLSSISTWSRVRMPQPLGPSTRITVLSKNEAPADSTTPLSISIWVTSPRTLLTS